MSLPREQGAGEEFLKQATLVDFAFLPCASLVRRGGRASLFFYLDYLEKVGAF
jgi:hypothetical protein